MVGYNCFLGSGLYYTFLDEFDIYTGLLPLFAVVFCSNTFATLQNDAIIEVVANTTESAFSPPTTTSISSSTNVAFTSSVQSTPGVSSTSTCSSGYVKCFDGRCEPFETLCGEGGIVTVTFPTPISSEATVTTHSPPASPLVSGATIGVSMSSIALTSQTTSLKITSEMLSTTETTPVAVVTDSNGKEVCLDGWELCMDGTCEPFHWLCTEHDGSSNVTWPAVTQVATEMTSEPLIGSSVPYERTTSLQTATTMYVTTGTSTVQVATTPPPSVDVTADPSGTCPNGFVKCADGKCEAFEALCGDQGIVTVVFPTGQTTEHISTMSPPSSGAAMTSATNAVSSTLTTTTTTTTTTSPVIVTDSSGQEVCLDGWEECNDGTCEPFHWLCTEHDGTAALIG